MKTLSLLFLVPAIVNGGRVGVKNPADDAYSINLVKAALKISSMFERVVISPVQKNIFRLGDRASIAILKIFNDQQLKDPTVVASFLPIIRESFTHSEYISIEADKTPSVTLFLLRSLLKSSQDAKLNAEVLKTIAFVEQQSRSR